VSKKSTEKIKKNSKEKRERQVKKKWGERLRTLWGRNRLTLSWGYPRLQTAILYSCCGCLCTFFSLSPQLLVTIPSLIIRSACDKSGMWAKVGEPTVKGKNWERPAVSLLSLISLSLVGVS
jgi:hypothetical protein